MSAIGTERIAKIVGYKIEGGDFSTTTPNLPQRIGIVAEANEANQATLDLTPKEITSAKKAGELYGFGSPIHQIMRILRPETGGGIGGIPTVVYPVAKVSGAAAKVLTLAVTGTATANGTHTLVIAGRENIDGQFYDFQVSAGDTNADITTKIEELIAGVLVCPAMVADNSGGEVTIVPKWNGVSSQMLNVSVNTNGNSAGITYAVTQESAGTGVNSAGITAALAKFENEWNTLVISGWGGEVASVMTLFENFNGIPDSENPTGRYSGNIMKPFVCLTGSVDADPTSITGGAKKDQVTIAICPAPNSKAFPLEAAANMAVLLGRQAQDNPHLDVSGMAYPDMPVSTTGIGVMADVNERDRIVKNGCSTVELVNGRYVVSDFITTYHPDGEQIPQFRYVRSLIIDFNIRFSYYLKEQIHVVDHAIAADNDTVSASKVVKPKMWTQVLFELAEDLGRRALISDVPFMQGSIQVKLSTTNPDRLGTKFKAKRSGFARIADTTAIMGFNFGTN